jgi:hypothetical protein
MLVVVVEEQAVSRTQEMATQKEIKLAPLRSEMGNRDQMCPQG